MREKEEKNQWINESYVEIKGITLHIKQVRFVTQKKIPKQFRQTEFTLYS